MIGRVIWLTVIDGQRSFRIKRAKTFLPWFNTCKDEIDARATHYVRD